MSQQEMVPTNEDFHQLWIELPIAQEIIQKVMFRRLLGESYASNTDNTSTSKNDKEEPSEPLFIPPIETSSAGSGIVKLVRVYMGGLVIKLGKAIQG